LLEVMTASKTQPFLHLHHQLQETFDRMARLAQPVIVACHGVCVGMALELALAADVRIASSDCVLGLPEIAFGIVPDVGGTTRLIRACGEVRARELILTGRLFKAAAAERYGVVHEVVEPADLHRVITERAEALAAHPAGALEHAKALCQASADTSTAGSLRLEGVVQQGLIANPELAAQFPKALAFIKAQLTAAR
jgi:enoyl-CoA hydratase/carnithine racemase